jgi:hypothetical protein
MNTQHAENIENFTSIDDIINFYTHTLNHHDSQKKDLDRNEKIDRTLAKDQT